MTGNCGIPLHGHFHLMSFGGERKAALGADFKTESNGFLDIGQRFLASMPLAYASRNRRTFDNPHPVFVSIQNSGEFHNMSIAGYTSV